MSEKKSDSVVTIHKIFKELIHLSKIEDIMPCFVRGVCKIVDIRYCAVFICGRALPTQYAFEKNHIIVCHRSDFHNALWNSVKDGLAESYLNFTPEPDMNAFDVENISVEIFPIGEAEKSVLQPEELEIVFQMPLVIDNVIVGAMVFIDNREVELNLSDLTTIGLISDQFTLVSEKLMLLNEVKEMAIKDFLTGVYNRRHFMERLTQEFARAKRFYTPLSLVMADIDHFKKINDTYGHLVGDQILVHVSKIIEENLRKVDITARYGGEEFVMLLPFTTREGALVAVTRIKQAIDSYVFNCDGHDVKVTISFGVSSFPENSLNDEAAFILTADNALYAAKEGGRNCIFQYTDDAIICVG